MNLEQRHGSLTAPHDIPEIDSQLFNDLFLTMAYNLNTYGLHGAIRNRKLNDRLCGFMPDNGPLYRDWKLKLRVTSQVAGSLIMRHGARPYLDELEEGTPTVTGIVTSINCDCATFNLDPQDGLPDKDREVTVIPVDERSLRRQAQIELVSIG